MLNFYHLQLEFTFSDPTKPMDTETKEPGNFVFYLV